MLHLRWLLRVCGQGHLFKIFGQSRRCRGCSRVFAGVRARVAGVRACVAGVRACVARVRACVARVRGCSRGSPTHTEVTEVGRKIKKAALVAASEI